MVVGDEAARKLSLKSTTARNLSKQTAHISKLTEAAWIQGARSPRQRRARVQELFRQYMKAVDAIVMLRAFRRGDVPHRYQLIEIPTSLFSSILQEPLATYESEAPKIDCLVKGAQGR